MRILPTLCLLLCALPLHAKRVAQNPEARPLTVERLAEIPEDRRAEWKAYLERSAAARAADKAFYASEMKTHGKVSPPSSGGSLKLEEDAAWYRSSEARAIADNIVSFQTPAGGWSKNTDMAKGPRRPGQSAGKDSGYDGTFDNDATTSHLTFLALVVSAAGEKASPAHKSSFTKGLDYIFQAQYPTGGWPQVWPLAGGYHDGITFNDGAMLRILVLLQGVASGQEPFAFADAELRKRAAQAYERGLACVMACQIVHEGRRTVWGQQHDPITLAPAPARAYEPAAQCASESAQLTLFLIRQPDPSPAVVEAIEAAAAWFRKTQIPDVVFKPALKDGKKDGRRLIPTPGAKPLWPRFSEIGTDRPLFGDRDRSLFDTVDDVSQERREGYAWFGDHGNRVLQHHEKWLAKRAGKPKAK